MKPAASTPLDVKLMHMTAMVLCMVFAVLAVLAAVRWVSRWSGFDIRAIVVTGDVSHNNAVTLHANVARRVTGTFFTADLDRVRKSFEAVPWVRHAVVRRDFPNRLRVELQEHQVAAYWGGNDGQRLLNTYGEIFEANVDEVDQEGVPQLNGPDVQSAQVLDMYRALAPLFAGMELKLEQLELTGRGSWRAQLDTGTVMELGRGDVPELVARVQRFLHTLTQVISKYDRTTSAVESADLRHENGYAIRLRGISTVVAEGPKQ